MDTATIPGRKPDFEKATEEIEKILRSPNKKEIDIQYNLATVLQYLDCESELEFQTGDGPADIYLPARRIIIETKTRKNIGPKKKLSSKKETQFEQCDRYAQADFMREKRQSLASDYEKTKKTPWQVLLTDGQQWWHWRSEIKNNQLKLLPRPKQKFESGKGKTAIRWLNQIIDQQVGKRWVPSDLFLVFKEFKEELDDIYKQLKKEKPTQTKFKLWLDLIRGSGSAPEKEDEREELFILHTLLVTVARAVILSLSKGYAPPPTM